MTENGKGELRPGSIVFGILVGLIVAFLSYQWITDPGKREQRVQQELAVNATRAFLREKLVVTELDIVDPLAPDRKVGKVYVYPADDGWEVSGYYRRDDRDEWHAYLALLDVDRSLQLLRVQDDDAALKQRAASDPAFEALR